MLKAKMISELRCSTCSYRKPLQSCTCAGSHGAMPSSVGGDGRATCTDALPRPASAAEDAARIPCWPTS